MNKLKNTNDKEDSLNNYSVLRKVLDKIDVHLTDSNINELTNKKKKYTELYLFKKKSLHNCWFNEIVEKMFKNQLQIRK